MNQTTPKLPNFIIFGSNKSGSTSLCNAIAQHPDVFISEKKEPNFFLYDEGSTRTKTNGKSLTYTFDWYQYWFKNATEAAIGEASVDYIADEKAPLRIKNRLPDVKLIALLREPVSRIYSQYLFHKRLGKEPEGISILDAIAADQKRSTPHKYFERGLYYQYLKIYFEVFGAENIKIFLFEDFTQNSLKVSQEVFEFIGVDRDFVPVLGAKDAASGIPKNKAFNEFILGDNDLRKAIRPIARAIFPNAEKRRVLWTRLLNSNLSRPAIDDNARQILADRYRDDVLALQDLIGRDLSKWLAPK